MLIGNKETLTKIKQDQKNYVSQNERKLKSKFE